MPENDYRAVIESLACRRGTTATIFADFCRMAACALATQTREDEYLEIAKRYSPDELKQFSKALALLIAEMEEKPFTDILGSYYLDCSSHSSKQARGEFFTPPAISKLMAHLLFDVDVAKAEKKPITINEPACGSGGMVLAVAELFAPDSVDLLRATAQDINPVAVDMAYINFTLWGIPARLILGDTIRMTATRQWCNVHWFRVGEHDRHRIEAMRRFISGVDTEQSGKDAAIVPSPTIDLNQLRQVAESKGGQFLFDF